MSYDFTGAVEAIRIWQTPKELSDALKTAALRLAALKDDGDIIKDMQLAVIDACLLLDAIKEIGD